MPGGKNNIHNHPNAGKGGFHNNPQNINRDGANSRLKQLGKKFGIEFPKGLSYEEAREMISSLLMMDLDNLAKLKQKKDIPIFLINISSSLASDSKEGKIDAINKLLDRVFGKATTNLNHQGDMKLIHQIVGMEIVDSDEEDDSSS